MSNQNVRTRWRVQASYGLLAGAATSAVDNVLFGGEVSPIVIVTMLLAATVTAAVAWGWRCWVAAIVIWAWVPVPHFIKRILQLPDTLHPNTYRSILMLGAFSFAVTVVGTMFGLLIRRFAARTPTGS
jgi:hypothetical protein